MAYQMSASSLEQMVRMKEAVSLGLQVDGTIRYSPGFNARTCITSRAFRYCLLQATGFLKKDAGNFPVSSLNCSISDKQMFDFCRAHLDGQCEMCKKNGLKMLLTSSVTFDEIRVNVEDKNGQLVQGKHITFYQLSLLNNGYYILILLVVYCFIEP